MSGLYVSSNSSTLVAQNQLTRNMGDLSNILTRLSTGLRINSGKDDPAGLIASELLKSEITGTTTAITNAQRANSIISIADSALGQVSSLLNDIKALVVESANTGAMTAEQIRANQLQVDASLDAIDRISKTTTYMGMKLLDGSLDFTTSGVSNVAVSDLTVHEANFGTSTDMNVNIQVLKDAEQAELYYNKGGISEDITLQVGGTSGTEVFSFDAGTDVKTIAEAVNRASDTTGVQAIVGNEATHGQIMLTSAGFDNDINLTALVAGAAGGNYTIKYTAGNSTETTYTITEPSGDQPGIIEFKLKMAGNTAASATNLDESYNGVYSYDLTGNADPTKSLIVQSDSGVQINQVEFIQMPAASSVGDPEKVAVDYNSKTGKLQIHYTTDALAADFETAINSITGLTYVSGNITGSAGANAMPSGYTVPTDLRANNGLNITAAIQGTAFENTDVVYIKGTNADSTSSFVSGTETFAITADDTPSLNGVKIKFVDDAATNSTFDPLTGTLTVGVNGVTDDAGLQAAIRAALEETAVYDNLVRYQAAKGITVTEPRTGAGSLSSLLAVTGTGNTTAAELAATSTMMSYSGSRSEEGLSYVDGAQAAAISLVQGGSSFRIVAKTTGSEYNDVKVAFEQTSVGFGPGEVSVVYDAEKGLLHIQGDIEGATFGTIKAAIEASSPFRVETDATLSNRFGALGDTGGMTQDGAGSTYYAYTGRRAGDIGTDNQTLFITTDGTNSTALDIANLFKSADPAIAIIASNFNVNVSGDGSGTIFANGLDDDVVVRSFTAALTGGSDSYTTAVTAKELVDFINNDPKLSQMFMADLALNEIGNGLLTLFDEAAYYGDIDSETRLQFLGPKDSPDIIFVTDGVNQELSISFSASSNGECVTDDRPVASVQATNPDASFTVQALVGGDEYEDMAVRIVRLNENEPTSYAQYVAGPSAAMAYCSIDNTIDSGLQNEQGKFVIYSTQGGEQMNNVAIVAKHDANQSEPVKAVYDESTKQFIITVNSVDVTLSQAMDAINNTGLFTADYDYTNNNNANTTTSDGPGTATFEHLFTGSGNTVTIGNTGETGGHNGTLTVYLAGDEITGQDAVDAINNSATTKNLFAANTVGSGAGSLNAREDTLKTVTGPDGKQVIVQNGVSGILGDTTDHPGYMIVHLATDQYGNPTTTAAELVDYFNSLTAEETKGISVSMIRPPGTDNLLRSWVTDNCGNVIEYQECADGWGKGILKPTVEVDDCDNITYFPIEFYSYGEDIQKSNATGQIVAANGINASLTITAKEKGDQWNGVGFRYIQVSNSDDMKAEYDSARNEIVVYVTSGTTAEAVKSLIENSESTKNLFSVSLPGNGTAAVTVADDYLVLAGGTYDAGYRGGAAMQGATDDDPHSLTFQSVEEGSSETITVKAKNGNFELKDKDGKTAESATGADMEATINGTKASAAGRDLTVSTSTLKMDVSLNKVVSAGDSVQFTITGGGAVFQIGPDVVTNQQIRISLPSVNTASLGGSTGYLYELRSGDTADLITSDESRRKADKIIDEAILSVSRVRGRLGTIQRCTLEPAINSLQDMLVEITKAEADISNADFAEESSNLTRAQILVQAASQALSIANQLPQYAASLLG